MSLHVIFLFGEPLSIPPNPSNVREYYAARELVQRGHKVTWIASISPKGVAVSKEKIRTITLGQSNYTSGSMIFKAIAFFRFLLSSKANVVLVCGWYTRSSMALFLLGLLFKSLRKKFVYDTIDPPIEYEVAYLRLREGGVKQRLSNLLMRVVYRLADAVIVVTEELKELLKKRGVQENRLHVIYTGTDKSSFNLSVEGESVREKLGLRSSFVIGWIGTMSPFKGLLEIVIPLIRHVKLNIPEAFFIIGGRGPLEKEFIELKKREPASPFIFLGPVPYALTPAYTAACDVYLVPMNVKSEFTRCVRPTKIFDAIAVGVPTLVVSTPSTRRLSAIFSSITFASDDSESFEKAILQIRKNYRKFNSLAVQDAKKIDEYTAQNSSIKIAELIENLCPGKRLHKSAHT